MAQQLPPPPMHPPLRTLEDAHKAIKALHEYLDQLRQIVGRLLP